MADIYFLPLKMMFRMNTGKLTLLSSWPVWLVKGIFDD
ncbi:hypothetical protein DAQ1742_00831 [Dickeya aquatica]|uniref:Uncharacterized protein n=1 Tax=Dickeya aquatica TaxID=1401087 RepID=A0A375A7A6_9GAMM|nr:hypothetical protein DAQ1742_00831 [Dickeya aquatica]